MTSHTQAGYAVVVAIESEVQKLYCQRTQRFIDLMRAGDRLRAQTDTARVMALALLTKEVSLSVQLAR